MGQRELQRALMEVCHHFLELGYEDAAVFAAATLAVPWDASGVMARAALELFERGRAFSGEDAALLGRLQALLDDLAAVADEHA